MTGPRDRLSIAVYLNGDGYLETMAEDVRAGLTATPKRLPPKYFYDDRGSELFEQITELLEYYPTRAERVLLQSIAPNLMASLRPREIVELGSGSSSKTQLLLDAPSAPSHLRRYVPFDVSRRIVEETAQKLLASYPFLEVAGVIGDFEHHLDRISPGESPRLVLFLGSTIGNLEPEECKRFLSDVRALLGYQDRLLLGLDLVKEVEVLNAAYNDTAGVTAEFNRNMLRVINNGLDADFDPDAFEHQAFFNIEASRIEMHLVAKAAQRVRIRGLDLTVTLEPGERIWTESSYKFTHDSVSKMLREAGMRLEQWHSTDQRLFGLALAAPSI